MHPLCQIRGGVGGGRKSAIGAGTDQVNRITAIGGAENQDITLTPRVDRNISIGGHPIFEPCRCCTTTGQAVGWKTRTQQGQGQVSRFVGCLGFEPQVELGREIREVIVRHPMMSLLHFGVEGAYNRDTDDEEQQQRPQPLVTSEAAVWAGIRKPKVHGMSGFREESLHRIFQSSFVRRKGILGPGDDCAELVPPAGRHLLQTVDQVIAGLHLEVEAAPAIYARKLLRRTLSDLAAAGATPWTVSWTLAVPPEWTAAQIRQLAKAFLTEAEAFRVPVVGGDCSQAPTLVLTCTATGLSNGKVPGRGGARVGDRILVTGHLGNAVQSGRHAHPEPRLKQGRRLVEGYAPHAMMDLSDGLARDLPRILKASDVGAQIALEHLPLAEGLSGGRPAWESAVGEGEDYELLVVLSPRQAKAALQDRLLQKTGLTDIGVIDGDRGLRYQEHGIHRRLQSKGWEVRWA